MNELPKNYWRSYEMWHSCCSFFTRDRYYNFLIASFFRLFISAYCTKSRLQMTIFKTFLMLTNYFRSEELKRLQKYSIASQHSRPKVLVVSISVLIIIHVTFYLLIKALCLTSPDTAIVQPCRTIKSFRTVYDRSWLMSYW